MYSVLFYLILFWCILLSLRSLLFFNEIQKGNGSRFGGSRAVGTGRKICNQDILCERNLFSIIGKMLLHVLSFPTPPPHISSPFLPFTCFLVWYFASFASYCWGTRALFPNLYLLFSQISSIIPGSFPTQILRMPSTSPGQPPLELVHSHCQQPWAWAFSAVCCVFCLLP